MHQNVLVSLLVACAAASSSAFVASPLAARSAHVQQGRAVARSNMEMKASATASGSSRGEFLRSVGSVVATTAAVQVATALPSLAVEEITTPSGLKIRKVKTGTGDKAEIGELVAIRFKGQYKDFVFDDILEGPEAFYIRLGSGNVPKGMDEALQMMPAGSRWELTVPGDLAFGKAGRPPSPGKPRIPPNAELTYDVILESIPGKDSDLVFDE